VAKPVILTVDDDPEVLGAVERDLRAHYRSDYRILKAGSGREALEAARQLKQRGTPIALFLVDERMPEMTGTELLREVLKLYPDSRRVLLTAYADTQAAIAGINDVGLNHYLLKPWDPPDQRLYPVLDDLLSDWTAHVRLPYEGIRVAGARSSPRSYAVKEFLSSNQVPYQWIDVDEDPPTRELIRSFGDSTRLPVLLFPDGSYLVAPTNRELAEKTGMQTRARLPFYDLVIVGAGTRPAARPARAPRSRTTLGSLPVSVEPTSRAGPSHRRAASAPRCLPRRRWRCAARIPIASFGSRTGRTFRATRSSWPRGYPFGLWRFAESSPSSASASTTAQR
jgi:thioredoxin reductase (NADPH)